jgi:hypothetical protein
MIEETKFNYQQEQEFFLFSTVSKLALGPSCTVVTGGHFLGYKALGMKLTTSVYC